MLASEPEGRMETVLIQTWGGRNNPPKTTKRKKKERKKTLSIQFYEIKMIPAREKSPKYKTQSLTN